jgi:hypothetical protein
LKYISHRPKLSARRLRQKAEQEACERQNKEDRSIMDGLIAEEVQARANIETKRKADKEARRLEARIALEAARVEAEARARVRAEAIKAIPLLRSYSNGELDFELTRRRQWPPTSVEVGIGYWQETSVDQLLEELVATPVDEASLELMKEWPASTRMVDQFGREHQVPITHPYTWTVPAALPRLSQRPSANMLSGRQHDEIPPCLVGDDHCLGGHDRCHGH